MTSRELYPKKVVIRTRVCKRCNILYETSGKFSKFCQGCRKPGGKQWGLNND